MARQSAACIAASHSFEDLLKVWNSHVSYIPTGVDTERFNSQRRLQNASPKFTWVGTFHHRDYVADIRFLLKCFRTVKSRVAGARLEIVGDGLYRNEVLKSIRQIGPQGIAWRGWIEPDRVPDYLETVDVGLYPLAGQTRFNKAKSPTKLYEYMAMGKTVIASAVGEARTSIRHRENGLVAHTASEFTDSMLEVARDQDLRTRLGRAAQQTVKERYSLQEMGRRLYTTICHSIG